MAVKIRLMRVGKKKQPSYRVVVADARSPRDGRFIEILGHYAPREEPSGISIDEDRALDWLRKGAQPTEQVSKLLDTVGVWDRLEAELGRPAKTKVVVSTKVRTARNAPPEPAPAAAPVAAPAPEPAPAAVATAPEPAEATAEAAAGEVEPAEPAADDAAADGAPAGDDPKDAT